MVDNCLFSLSFLLGGSWLSRCTSFLGRFSLFLFRTLALTGLLKPGFSR